MTSNYPTVTDTPRPFSITIATAAVAVLVLASAACRASAQTHWLTPRNYDAVVLEILKPTFDDAQVGFATSAAVVTAQVGLGQRKLIFLTADLPLSHLAVKGGESETALGNPYVGLTAFDKSNPVIYEIGVRLPLASDNSGGITGSVGDFDRFEAYMPDRFAASAALTYFPSRDGDWVLQTRLGPTFLLNTSPGEFEASADLYANYSIQAWYFKNAFQGALGLSGRFLITDDGTFGERLVQQAGATVQIDLKSVVPGVHVRLPLDHDLSDIINLVYGVNVVVPFD